MIGGNVKAVLRQMTGFEINSIGEQIPQWADVATLLGWLDLSSGDSKYTHDTKKQESTHIFMCDYAPIDLNAENKRLMVNGVTYDVLFMDDPMGMHQHLEITLKCLG